MREVVALFVVAAALGCQTQSRQLYPGPARPYAEIAILERESGRGIVRFQAIDGVEVKGDGFHVLPGEHRVEVMVRLQAVFSTGGGTYTHRVHVPCSAVFEAEAGKTYFIRADVAEMGRGSMHRSFTPELWVAARNAPKFNIAKHSCVFEQ